MKPPDGVPALRAEAAEAAGAQAAGRRL